MLWSQRTIFMLLVVGAPVVIACFLRIIVLFGAQSSRITTTQGV
jgi:hypothetical protein